jgi:hypothetical protein
VSAEPLPLADAAARLRGKPGRPPKPSPPRPSAPAQFGARLFDVPAAAVFLGVSTWTIRDMIAAGTLPRVRVPLPGGGELRKILLDSEDLARLIGAWKDRPTEAGR